MERPKTTHTRGVFRYLKDVRRPCCPELCRARCVVRDRNGTPSAPHKRCVFLSFSLLVSNGRDPDHQTTLLPRMQPTIVRPFSPRTPARHLVLVLLTSTLVSTITGTPPASRTICRRKDTKSERTTRKGANRYIRQGVGEGIDKTGASDGARSRTAHGIFICGTGTPYFGRGATQQSLRLRVWTAAQCSRLDVPHTLDNDKLQSSGATCAR